MMLLLVNPPPRFDHYLLMVRVFYFAFVSVYKISQKLFNHQLNLGGGRLSSNQGTK